MRYIFLMFLLMGCSASYYKKLPVVWKERILRTDDLTKLDRNYIYPVTGDKLKEELFKYEKSMVVIFVNKCTSNYCVPLKVYEDYAVRNNYKLFLIMQDLNHLDESYNQFFYSPLLVIDEEYYKGAWNTNKHFEEDLLGNLRQKEYKGSIYLFEKGTLSNILRTLPN